MGLIRSLSFRLAICLFPVAGFFTASFAEGVLTVKTDPDGIEVWLGDKFLGQSPIYDKKVKAGKYVLKLVDPTQHTSSNEDIFLQDGDTTVVDRTISSKFGILKVTSDPPGADAIISTELGKTPLTNEFMNPGRYRLEVRPSNPQFVPSLTEITITKGQTVPIDIKLDEKKFFTTKKLVSLGCFAGTVGGFVWAYVAHGNYSMSKQQQSDAVKLGGVPSAYDSDINSAGVQQVLGLILGSGCAVGLTITALF
jgi:hypothetical protein